MTEHLELARALTAHGRHLRAALGSADLSVSVVDALQHRRTPSRTWRPSRTVRVAALVAVLVALLASAAYAGYRLVVAVGPVTVREGPVPNIPVGRRLALGMPVTRDDPRIRISVVTPHLPWLSDQPQRWFDRLASDQVSLTFPPRAGLPEIGTTGVGLLVQEFAGDGHETIRKFLTGSSRAEPVRIGSATGVFLTGGDHTLFYLDHAGHYVTSQGRLAGNALIFQRDGLTVRIEADLTREAMVEIASSLRR